MFDAGTGKSLARNNSSGFIGINNPRLIFSDDDAILRIQGVDDSRLRKFDGQTLKEKKLPDLGPLGHVTCLAVSADGSRIITGCNEDLPRIFNGMTGEQLRRYSPSLFGAITGRDDSGVGGLAITADGSLAALRMNDDRVILWEPQTGRTRRTINLDGAFAGDTVAFSPDGKTVAVGPGGFAGPNRAKVENPLRQFDVATGKERPSIANLGGQVSSLAYSPCGKWIGAVSQQQDESPGYLLFDASSGRLLRSISGTVFAAAFVPFGDAIVYSSPDELVMWEPTSGLVRVRYTLPKDDMIDLLAVSPCGRWLAGANNGSGTRKIYLWDLRTGHVLPPLYGHNHYIASLAFGPNGRLVSGSFDTTALVWDVTTRHGPAPAALAMEQWPAAWADLAGDGTTAHNTIERLLATGPAIVPFLRERVRPATAVDPAIVTDLVSRLDAAKFADRQRATLELERLDRIVEPALKLVMQDVQSAETRRRVQRLLDRLDGPYTDPERVREMRAIEIVTRLNDPDGVVLLKELAGGEPAARLTQAARRACERR
jgi:WD40 repeat protein